MSLISIIISLYFHATNSFFAFLKSDGTIYRAGYNGNGQQGNSGTATSISTFAAIGYIDNPSDDVHSRLNDVRQARTERALKQLEILNSQESDQGQPETQGQPPAPENAPQAA